MMFLFRKTIACLLSAAMLLSLLPAAALAGDIEDIPDEAPAAVQEETPAPEDAAPDIEPEDTPDAAPDDDAIPAPQLPAQGFEVPAVVAEGEYSGMCGVQTTWAFDPDTGVLSIGGLGWTHDFYGSGIKPWAEYEDEITSVVVGSFVTGLGANLFNGCKRITSVTLSSPNFEGIGYAAFSGCTALKNITWGSTESIGNGAFAGCTALTSVSLPDSVITIGDSAFRGCTGLTSVTMNQVTAIYGYAFHNCTGLTQITIPNSCTLIDNNAFWGCTGLTSVSLGSGLITIGDGAFGGNTALTSITIPNSVKTIGDSAFENCVAMKTVSFGSSVTSIGKRAFCNCISLTAISLPDSVKTIGGQAFMDCSGVKTFRTGSGLTAVAGGMCERMTSLTSITLPASVKDIGTFAFSGDTHLESVTLSEGLVSIRGNAFQNCTSLQSIAIPEGTVVLEGNAFNGCTSLETASVPGTVDTVGRLAFSGCTSLASVTLGAGIREIKEYAFDGCTVLKSVQMGTGLETIGERTFQNCALLSAEIPAGTKSIGAYAFIGCGSMSSVRLEEGLQTIGSGAFQNCSSLKSVVIPHGVSSVGANIFQNCTALTSAVIPGTVSLVPNYAFNGCTHLKTLSLGSGIENIGSGAFQNCSSLPAAVLPGGVLTIGANAFAGCSALASVNLPEGLQSIGDNAFAGCALPSIALPDSLEQLGEGAFSGSGLTALTFPAGIGSVPVKAAYECVSLKSVVIPEGLQSIGVNAFNGCTALESLTIPVSVTSIGGWATYRCNALTDIRYGGSEAQWAEVSIGNVNDPLTQGTVQYGTPMIITQPDDFTGFVGKTVKITTAASGNGLSYRWQYLAPSGTDWANTTLTGYKTATLSVPVTAARNGYSYRCKITDADGNTVYTNAAVLTVCTQITEQPAGVSAAIGDTAQFTVLASGAGLQYQWQYKSLTGRTWSSTTMSGAKTDTLSVPVIAGRNGYSYRCKITDANGTVTISDAGVLIAEPAFSVLLQPSDFIGEIGTSAVFVALGSGSDLSYQWQYKTATGTKWSSSTASGAKTMICMPKISASVNGYSYRCVITDAAGHSVTTDAAVLHVGSGLAITSQPQSVETTSGKSVQFTVAASGSDLSYQWQYMAPNGTAWANTSLTGNKTAALTVSATIGRDGYSYRCKITDAFGYSVTTDAAVLHVTPSLSITAQPQSVNTVSGKAAEFTVAASGSDLSYQWQYKTASGSTWADTTLTGNKTAALTVSATTARDGYQFRCVITAGGTSVTSEPAALRVLGVKAQPADAIAAAGSTAKFTVAATGDVAAYQWQYMAPSGSTWASTSLTGSKTAALSVSATAGRDGYAYRCKITDTAGNVVYSQPAVLTVE